MRAHRSAESYKASSEYSNVAEGILPPEWTSQESGPWKQYDPQSSTSLPEFGWKIHLSANPGNAETILAAAATVALAHSRPFKMLRDPNFLAASTSKRWEREASGKFVTIYPSDAEELVDMVRDLGSRLQEEDGPYILTDRQSDSSKVVFYRYGRLLPNAEERTVTDPHRKPFYSPPNDVDDPFGGAPPANAHDGPVRLTSQWLVDHAIRLNPTGGIYAAHSASISAGPMQAIIKEGRPNTDWDPHGRDTVARRKREAEVLRALDRVACTPKLLDSFQLWGHYYVVQERLAGTSYEKYHASFENPLLSGGRGGLTDALPLLKGWQAIGSALSQLHDLDWTVGDLTPDNIVMRQDIDGRPPVIKAVFVDTECFHHPELEPPFLLSRREFSSRTQGAPGAAKNDDVFSFFMTALFGLFPISRMRMLHPPTWAALLTRVADGLGILPVAMPMIEVGIRDSPPKLDILDIVREQIDAAIALASDSCEPRDATHTRTRIKAAPRSVVDRSVALSEHRRAAVDPTSELRTYDTLPYPSREYLTRPEDCVLFGPSSTTLSTLVDSVFFEHPAARSWEGKRSPGLYTGSGGLLFLHGRLGNADAVQEHAPEWLELASEAIDDDRTPINLASGLAGMAIVASELVDIDVRFGPVLNRILDRLLVKQPEGQAVGLLYGRSGVAAALADIAMRHPNRHSQAVAGRAATLMEFDQDSLQIYPSGVLGLPQWNERAQSITASPGWSTGLAGYVLAALKVGELTGASFLPDVDLATDSLSRGTSVSPNFLEGGAGIAGTLLRIAGRSVDAVSRREHAREMLEFAESMLVTDAEKGLLVAPGRDQATGCMDLAYGSAGVALAALSARQNLAFVGLWSSEALIGGEWCA